MNDKIKIGVIFGGKSGEHEVSLMSAYNILKALDKDKYEPVLFPIDHEGKWSRYNGDIENIKDGSWEKDEANLLKNIHLFNDELTESIDLFFPVLHGTFGEDGTVQGLFEMLDKPYVGCGVLASSVLMDKQIAKVIFESAGLNVAKGLGVEKEEIVKNVEAVASMLEKAFGYPLFIKPANMGSSVGISKAKDKAQLIEALNEAIKYDSKILIEEFIFGKEIEVAVLGNDEPKASCPGLIIPCNEFYDYEAKYLSGDDSAVVIPAPIGNEKAEQIRQYAIKAFKAAGCTGLARVDFFLTENGKIVINEINTLPGFTNISMYPKLWEQCGVSYKDLIDKLCELAFEHYNKRKELSFKKI